MTLYPPQLLRDLADSTLFLDTNVFSIGSRSVGLLDLLTKLRNDAGCDFTSIPSVLFELVRGSNSIEAYNESVDFFNDLVSYTNPLTFIDKLSDFSIVMAKVNASNKSYTDFLLAACLYQYRNSGKVFLLTSDLKALPSFYDREYLITTDEDKSKEVRNLGIYKFNTENYVKTAQQVISESH